VKAAYERLSFENLIWVGVDEMNRRKGHNYLTVFADLLAKRVLFATRNNARKREQLERTRWMWLKNRVNWTEKEVQKWESMALERSLTGMAYEMRLVLQGIYQWKDVVEARKLFGNWCAWVQPMRERTGELLEPMARAARMIEGTWRVF
jgi:hypothetical protein